MRAFRALALAALAACTQPNGGPDAGNGDTSIALSTCTEDSECATGFKCDRERRRCACVSDSSCPGGFCNAFTGQCVATVPGCTSDAQCAEHEYCDAGIRTCRLRRGFCERCDDDRQCGGPEDYCFAHPEYADKGKFCGVACGSGCGEGRKCVDIGNGVMQCVPQVGYCGSGAVTCEPDSGRPCDGTPDIANRQCEQTAGPGQVCDLQQKICVASATVCRPGTSCDPITRTCVAACTRDDQCPGQNYRCRNNTCVPVALCQSDGDCTAPKICLKAPGATFGECGQTCTSTAECPQGQRCLNDPALGRVRCTPGCGTNLDCALNQVCLSGQCDSTPVQGHARCQTTDVCAFKENCTAANSSTPYICLEDGRPLCRQCTPSQTGSDPVNCGTNRCVSFLTAECPSGSNSECPQGSVCTIHPTYGFVCALTTCAITCDPARGDSCPKGFGCYPFGTQTGTVNYCYPADAACH
jgi:hypothetical protein